jgi:hypothetical protein
VELERSYDSESEVESSPKTVTSGGITYSRDKYYCDVTVKPFGLRELYLMADVDAYDDHIDYYSHSNLEMLDHQEYYERLFLRSSVAIVGPSYDEPRNSLSTIFSDLEAEYGTGNATGRSAWYYIKDPYNLKDLDLSNVQPVELVGVDLDQLRDFLNNLPDGANVLDLLQYYINQGWFPNSYRGLSGGTIKQSGCCDTTYMMIYQFMTGTKLTSAEIEQISRTYVDASGNFQTNKFLSDHGLTSTSGNLAFSPTGIINEINNSRPVVLHIRGQWTYNGTTYHGTSNGHFLTIIGYDDKGFYVADPGSSSNTNNGPIPYEAFGNVSDLYYRTIGKSGT